MKFCRFFSEKRAASLTFDETSDLNRLRVTISNWFCPLAIMMIIFLSACPRLKTKLDFLFPLHTTYSQKHKSSPCRARQLDIILENLSGHISRLIIFNGSALKASHHCNVTLEAENINLGKIRSGTSCFFPVIEEMLKLIFNTK